MPVHVRHAPQPARARLRAASIRDRNMTSHDQHIGAICKLLRSCAYRHNLHRLFSDCMETTAIAISNSVDLRHRDSREKRYLEIVGRYERKVVEMFPQVLGHIVMALEDEPRDILGPTYMGLELGNAQSGQFFTPYSVCRFMAELTLGNLDEIRTRIAANGFVTTMEPACGAGAMIIALADAMRAHGINYQQHLHVTAIDVDASAAHMAYIQFSLLHIPAKLFVGDSLSGEMRECWFTPAHILGGWSARLARRDAETAAHALIAPPPEPQRIAPAAPAPRGREEGPRQLSLF
ncbi:N-6 DNA methylase [Sandaracinobacter sp. RS1-74]|uniref:N-6 DNA methylase n=1 Tax=Sandaracinobacteroides sayramensis TaxID=2913411 RepID=UPI001EDBFF2A|nr:N-6 DNA methylase [Sandaracinobacteroides sayramensis]MCG2841272.1 N-6 DNA methylase [Sandaracinobacteroides sayramensis]